MLFGYDLRLCRNTEPGYKYRSGDRSSVLWDVWIVV